MLRHIQALYFNIWTVEYTGKIQFLTFKLLLEFLLEVFIWLHSQKWATASISNKPSVLSKLTPPKIQFNWASILYSFWIRQTVCELSPFLVTMPNLYNRPRHCKRFMSSHSSETICQIKKL